MTTSHNDSVTSTPPPPPSNVHDRRYARPAGGRKRRGCLPAILISGLALLIVCALGGVAVLFVVLANSPSLTAGRDFSVSERILSRAQGTSDKIAVVDIQGIIMGTDSVQSTSSGVIKTVLRDIERDPDVVAVVLNMDTPGGEVIASDEIHRAVAGVNLPVVACMRGVCASGGYYIAAAADHVIANEVTITGSIGVIIPRYQYHELLEKIGIRTDSVRSGAMKDMLSGGRSRAEQEQATIDSYVQGLVNETFRRFCIVVAEGRDQFLTWQDVKDSPFGDGRILLGRQAFELGLVDELGYFDHAIEAAKRLAGVKAANVVRFKRDFTFTELLFAKSRTGIRLETGLDAALPRLEPTRMYYLMPDLVNSY